MEPDPFRRLVAAATQVCRLAEQPDVFDEYHDSDELQAFLDALVELEAVLREVDPVPLPPADLPVPTLAGLLSVLLAEPDAPGVEDLAPRLDDDQVEEVLRVALTRHDGRRQADLLRALAPYLTPAQAERALAAVPDMASAGDHALALAALLPRLPAARRPAAARFAAAAARGLPLAFGSTLLKVAPWLDEAGRAELYALVAPAPGEKPGPELCWLAGHFSPEQRSAALGLIVGIEDENLRAALLGALAQHLDEVQLADAVAAAGRIAAPGIRARALTGLAGALTGPRRRQAVHEALTAARRPGSRTPYVLPWQQLFALLDPDQLGDALAAVLAVPYEDARAHALGLLAPHLTPAELRTAVAGAGAMHSALARAHALAPLVLRLPEEARPPVVAATVDALVAKPFAWAPPLRVVAPLLTAAQLNRLWEAALREEEERPKEGLAILAAYVDWDRRDEALRLALGYEHQLVPDALRGLAPHLDDAQRRRAYEGVQEIEELPSRASALAELVPYLPAAEAEAAAGEAVATAGAVRGPAARARLLVGLVPLLRGPARKTALAWAFAAATAIPPEERDLGFTALTALVPLLPEPAERE